MDFRPIRILLIEDNPGDARLIQELLKEIKGLRFEVEVADRLAKGLERLNKGNFNVIMVDLTLPDSHGLATFLNIQAQAPSLPSIVLTGIDDEDMALRAVQEGAQDYLVKGQCDSNLLARSIRYAIERKHVEEQLLHHALRDVLTGLPNRAVLTDRIERAIRRTKRRHDYHFAVLFLDLDEFKKINDTNGHLFGDQMLRIVAKRLEGCLRPGDSVARFGGDEFVLLIDDIRDIGPLANVADRIQKELAKPFNINGKEISITASVGIALNDFEHERPEELLRDADTAMYRAKGAGGGRYEIFHIRKRPEDMQILHLEKHLRRAIERNEMHVYYQPIVNLKTGVISGFEALLRWRHPRGYLVYPSVFIPVAERNQLIESIGEWVIRRACAEVLAWQKAGFGNLRVAVNLSNRQFHQRNLVEVAAEALDETGIPPECLELEITESTAAHNAELAIAVLGEFKKIGIKLAIDDFGTGYSSLSYLKRFPIDILKIDQSFVRDIPGDPDDAAIARSIIAIAHSLNMTVIAEGVETGEQLDFLRAENCDEIQGHFFCQALPAEEVMKLLQEDRRLKVR